MRIKPVSLALALVLVSASYAHAQRVEIQPFVGGRFGGGFTVQEPIPGGTRPVDFNIESGLTWGATFAVALSRALSLEFLWSRQESAISAESATVAKTTLFDAAVSQYHGNLVVNLGDPDNRVRPFILVGAGATVFDPDVADVDNETKFSFGIGAGIKAYFNDHVGIRLQGRYTPTYITETPEFFCYFYCYVAEVADYANQAEVTAGMTFRF